MELPELPAEAVVGWGLGGSRLYGLHSPDSDYDLTCIVDHHSFPAEAQYPTEKIDLRIIPASRYVRAMSAESSPNYVDLHFSRSFYWYADHPLYPYIRAAGFSTTKYIAMLQRHTISMLHQYLEAKKDDKRLDKMLKVALRNSIMAAKMLNEGENFNPTLTPEQRDKFYDLLEDARSVPKDYEALLYYVTSHAEGDVWWT